jgi:hypothetical protein
LGRQSPLNSLKVPSTPFKCQQCSSMLCTCFVPTSGLLRGWFDIWSVRLRSFFGNKANNSRTKPKVVSTQSQCAPEGSPTSARIAAEQSTKDQAVYDAPLRCLSPDGWVPISTNNPISGNMDKY